MKKALITGMTGQDGYYLSKLLVSRGYEVSGFVLKNDADAVEKILKASTPDEIYNLAAVSDIASSLKDPDETMCVNFEAPCLLLKTAFDLNKDVRFCQASSREIFRQDVPAPQDENSPLGFSNPYGEAKLKTHLFVRQMREKDEAFACSAIFYNHESPRRQERFVTKKITSTLAKIKLGSDVVLELGNLDAVRDWGFAGDYMDAVWRILQAPQPDEYVISSGKGHTVRDFVNEAARVLEVHLSWYGDKGNEVALDESGKVRVKIDSRFYRPLEPFPAIGDNAKAKHVLGWKPETSFEKLVEMMTLNDLEYARSL